MACSVFRRAGGWGGCGLERASWPVKQALAIHPNMKVLHFIAHSIALGLTTNTVVGSKKRQETNSTSTDTMIDTKGGDTKVTSCVHMLVF